MKHHKKKKKDLLCFLAFSTDPCKLYSKLCSPETENEPDCDTKLFTGINKVQPPLAEKEPTGQERRSGCSRVELVELWHCQESLQKLTGYRQTINSLPSSGSITWISFALIRHLNERVLLSK